MRLLFGVILIIFISGCGDRCLNSIGNQTEEIRMLDAFEKIEIFDNINLVWHYDSIHYVSIEAGKNLITNITTDVNGGWLFIEDRNTCDFVRSYDHQITVHVYSPEISQIDCANSGNIYAEDTIKTRHFQYNQWSASGINELLLDADTASLKLHTGTGDLTAQGECTQVYIYSASYGEMQCTNLDAVNGWVTSRNTGHVYMNVENNLEVFLHSKGNIHVSNSPNIITSILKGEGELIID